MLTGYTPLCRPMFFITQNWAAIIPSMQCPTFVNLFKVGRRLFLAMQLWVAESG
ncbi:hypothetical protein CJA_0222 [Cellvibrio japonicus Ueda107]|uniref:Uncharacterized protein n=1 Tax=Cellvibrio japonicus (strain Ueda107) TaxID=498211 RepID=B3PGG7_CELJU|nr:hypothetical protein CJA_0222 [Cellvibrio japonicus Ueda107]